MNTYNTKDTSSTHHPDLTIKTNDLSKDIDAIPIPDTPSHDQDLQALKAHIDADIATVTEKLMHFEETKSLYEIMLVAPAFLDFGPRTPEEDRADMLVEEYIARTCGGDWEAIIGNSSTSFKVDTESRVNDNDKSASVHLNDESAFKKGVQEQIERMSKKAHKMRYLYGNVPGWDEIETDPQKMLVHLRKKAAIKLRRAGSNKVVDKALEGKDGDGEEDAVELDE